MKKNENKRTIKSERFTRTKQIQRKEISGKEGQSNENE
jgi:hypothetical protein